MEADATDLIAEVGDFTIKQLIEGGVLNDAPVLGWFAKAARTGIALRDYFLIQKIGTFLNASGASPADRDKFRPKLQTDDKFKSEVARLLVLTLDRLDELEKACLLGRIFAALVYYEITRDEMRRLCSARERVYLRTFTHCATS